MDGKRQRGGREVRPDKVAGAYMVIVRGADGRPHVERLADAAAYGARLAKLQLSNDAAVSIEEIAGLLDRS